MNNTKDTMPVEINGVVVSRPIEYVEYSGIGRTARPIVESGLIEVTQLGDGMPRYITELPVAD